MIRFEMRSCSGPMPCSGEIAPCRTWKTPLKCLVFSMAAMLVGSSTTQTRRWLRVGAGAVDAGIDVSDVVADRAETEVGLDVAHGGGEGFGIFVAGAKNVESQTLCALCANARELFQLIDQARHGFGKFGHRR